MPQRSDIQWGAETNGQRLARLRKRRRWDQRKLATESGYSLSAVKKFEQGNRSLDRADVILRFVKALDCHPTEITGQPYAPPDSDPDGQAAAASVAAVRRVLMRHGRPAWPTEQEVSGIDLAGLRARVAQANAYRQRSALAKSGAVLPGLLRDLQVAADLCVGEERRLAFGLLASGYECAMQYLYKLGHTAAATLATERVVWCAEATEDPLRRLSSRWYDAGEFLSIGEHDEAGAIIDDALTELSSIRASRPEAVSLRGLFHLKASLNHARAADGKAAEMQLQKAQEQANRLGEDRNDFELQFGPTNTAIWSVTLPVEMGRGKDAVRRAEQVTASLPADYAPERRSHHWIDVGRAHFYNGQRDEALDAFLTAERMAPQATRMHAGVRETTRMMVHTQRRSSLVEFGLRLGVV
ncbi:helix-turn-helix domain-containing protein [Streptomyces boncukensis]|uniref:Helix-turn-helix transcriptional regulator n=1 Tax=Streptomyces boncukensis TaxID=2711219 RepID=A0A6G4WR48_9ACTN|nr:helix-turn-helix transcriptional regulator [Streptomyces boncukensis]NGO66971.1 helix-turn-helix transcriptional regulator [Streptomyces boncukensis]